MAYIFSDSFDWYTTNTDAGNGYWETASSSIILATGRFTGSQAVGMGAAAAGTVYLAKSSSTNDATHHIVCAFQQSVALSGTISGMALTFLDGTSSQCSIVFRSDGAILLTSGAGNGSTLATYTSAFSASTWTAFEFEVTIDNSAGVFRARKNGNSVNDFQATNLNTRAGTTNNYANKLQVSFTTNSAPLNSSTSAHQIDDLLWFSASGSAPNTWVGDVRSYVLMPSSDVSTQFSKMSSSYAQTPYTLSTTTGILNGTARYSAFTAAFDGAIGSATVSLNTGYSGNMKCSIFSSSGSAPTTVLGSATPISNPTSGFNTFTFGTPVNVAKGTQYYIGFDSDTGSGVWNVGVASGNLGLTSVTAYASFPAASPSVTSGQGITLVTLNITIGSNATLTADTQQDGSTSYVYSSSVGATDFYNVADLPGTPASIVAVTTRGYAQKSDAGTRIGQIQMKSGSTTVQTGAVGLATSFTWQSRTDITDPNTGLTWTASGVNNLQIGPTVGG